MRSPVNRACIRGATVRGILDSRKSAPQKFPRRVDVIPTACEIVLIGVKSPAKSACSGGRSRKKQVCIIRVLKIGLGKESKVFVRSHPQIVWSAKGGHFAFHSEKNFLGLRR